MNDASWQAITWDIARVGGFVAYGLVLSSVVLGLALSLRWRSVRYPRFVTNELHRFVTLLAIVFIGVHGVALLVDPFIKFTPVEVLIPFVGHYRPIWAALGISAGYLAVALYLSERVRSRIGYANWRRLHYLTFLVFALATIHGIGTGSDTRTPWALAIYVGGVAIVGVLLAARLWPAEGGSPRRLWLGVPLSVAVVVASVWTVRGPLAPGWGATARAGSTNATDSASVIGSTAPAGPAATPSPAPTPVPVEAIALPFQASMSGTAQQSGGPQGVITVDARFSGAAAGRLTATIPLSRGAQSAPLTVVVEPTGATCSGSLTFARGQVLGGTCALPDGRVLGVAMQVGLDDSGALVGTLQVTGQGEPTKTGSS